MKRKTQHKGLMLTRKKGESIMIGDDIEVTIVEDRNGRVKLAVKAPQTTKVWRREIYNRLMAEQASTDTDHD